MTVTDRDHIFRTIVESAVDFAIVAMDRDGIVVEWNTGAERVLGWAADEIRGQPADRFFTPEDRAGDRPAIEMQAALRDGRASDERWHIRKNGTRFWANGEMMPLRDAEGAHLGFVKIFRDRTAQRLEAERQRAEAEFLKGVLASSDDCIKVLDLDGRVAFMSEGGQRVMEVSDFNAIAGCPWPDFWEGAGNVAAREAIASARAGGSAHFQGGANTMAGNYRWWDVKVTPILGADGRPEKILSISRDVSTVREVQETLRRMNETLEQRVEERTHERDRAWKHSIDLQAVVARDGTIIAANEAWTTMLGWPVDEVVGRSHLTFNHPDHVGDSSVVLAHGTGRCSAYETRCLCKDGGVRWISWVAAPEGDLVYASGRDVTAQKDQAAKLAQVEEALRQAQKMEAVGQLTGGIAHDFNNMLTGVIGSIDLIQRNLATGRMDRVHRYLDAATTSAQRAAALTARLLAFGRRQSLDLQPVEVNHLVSGMEDLLYRTLGEQIALETHLSTGLWLAHTDANQLESALLNLCINARDAMPDGGHLTIETINATLEEGDVGDPAELIAGDYIVLCVSDTGSGMAPAIVGKVFEPFFTTKPVGQGTGLGLSMIYGFAKQSGGHVQIDSELGRGTTIKLFVPRFHGEKPVSVARPDGPIPSGTGETVMVVEDDPSVRLIVLEVLEELGYHAIEAVDARGAIPILQSDRRIDLLVSDVGLPGMNGRQLADIARETRPALKVLFITGYAENAGVRGGFLGEGMEMMTKPFAVEALATRIRELLGE